LNCTRLADSVDYASQSTQLIDLIGLVRLRRSSIPRASRTAISTLFAQFYPMYRTYCRYHRRRAVRRTGVPSHRRPQSVFFVHQNENGLYNSFKTNATQSMNGSFGCSASGRRCEHHFKKQVTPSTINTIHHQKCHRINRSIKSPTKEESKVIQRKS